MSVRLGAAYSADGAIEPPAIMRRKPFGARIANFARTAIAKAAWGVFFACGLFVLEAIIVRFDVFRPLSVLAASLEPELTSIAQHSLFGTLSGYYVVSAVLVAASALLFACSFWLMFERMRAAKLRRTIRADRAYAERIIGSLQSDHVQTKKALVLRDRLLAARGEAVVAWHADMGETYNLGGGTALMKDCLAGPNAANLSAALNALIEDGIAFALTARTDENETIKLRGHCAGSYAAVFLQKVHGAEIVPAPPPGHNHVFAEGQRAILDTLPDSAAIFGQDGRLKLCNTAFMRQWQFSETDILDEPHLKRLSGASAARFGHDATWEIVASSVASTESVRIREWRAVTRSDGKVFSLSLKRLPQDATLVTFADVTRHYRPPSAMEARP